MLTCPAGGEEYADLPCWMWRVCWPVLLDVKSMLNCPVGGEEYADLSCWRWRVCWPVLLEVKSMLTCPAGGEGWCSSLPPSPPPAAVAAAALSSCWSPPSRRSRPPPEYTFSLKHFGIFSKLPVASGSWDHNFVYLLFTFSGVNLFLRDFYIIYNVGARPPKADSLN